MLSGFGDVSLFQNENLIGMKNVAGGAVVSLQSKVSDGASYLFHGRNRRLAH